MFYSLILLSKLIKKLNCGYYINYGEEYKLKDILKLEFDHINESKIDYYKARQIFSKEQQAEEYLNLFKKVIR